MHEIEELYEIYHKELYSYFLYLCNDESLSYDLLQDTFIQIIKSIHTFKQKSSIKTWIYAIARNVWKQYLKKQKKEVSFDPTLEHLYIVEKDSIERANYEHILTRLEKKHKKAYDVVMFRLDGYSFYEIANHLQISESSARVLFHRGKHFLQQEKERLIQNEVSL